MLIVIIHSRGMAIPYHVISDLSGIKEPAGTHIPLPAKSKREVVEGVQEFIEKAHQENSMISLLVVSEELYASLKLEQHEEIDCMLFQYADNSGAPAVSVWKNGIGDEGVTYEEFLQDFATYDSQVKREAAKPKVFSKTQRAA